MDAVNLIFVAVCEEFFFRGFLLDWVICKYKVQSLKAALSVSVVFALLHFVNGLSYATWGYVFCQVVFAFGVSMLLSWLYIEHNSIMLCILVHGSINLCALFLEKINEHGLAYITMLESAVYIAIAFLCIAFSVKRLRLGDQGL